MHKVPQNDPPVPSGGNWKEQDITKSPNALILIVLPEVIRRLMVTPYEIKRLPVRRSRRTGLYKPLRHITAVESKCFTLILNGLAQKDCRLFRIRFDSEGGADHIIETFCK